MLSTYFGCVFFDCLLIFYIFIERIERGKAKVLSEKKGTVILVCRMSISSTV